MSSLLSPTHGFVNRLAQFFQDELTNNLDSMDIDTISPSDHMENDSGRSIALRSIDKFMMKRGLEVPYNCIPTAASYTVIDSPDDDLKKMLFLGENPFMPSQCWAYVRETGDIVYYLVSALREWQMDEEDDLELLSVNMHKYPFNVIAMATHGSHIRERLSVFVCYIFTEMGHLDLPFSEASLTELGTIFEIIGQVVKDAGGDWKTLDNEQMPSKLPSNRLPKTPGPRRTRKVATPTRKRSARLWQSKFHHTRGQAKAGVKPANDSEESTSEEAAAQVTEEQTAALEAISVERHGAEEELLEAFYQLNLIEAEEIWELRKRDRRADRNRSRHQEHDVDAKTAGKLEVLRVTYDELEVERAQLSKIVDQIREEIWEGSADKRATQASIELREKLHVRSDRLIKVYHVRWELRLQEEGLLV